MRTMRRLRKAPCVLRRGLATAAVAPKGSWKLGLQPIPSFTKPQSLTDMLFGRSTMPQIPLNQAAVSVPQRTEVSPSAEVKVSTLANGVKVATREFQAPLASVGIFVNSGSRDETAENAGVSHFLETAAFASTRTRTDFRLIRDTSRLGAALSVDSSREVMKYTGEALANWTRPVVESLGDLVKRPAFIDFELRDLVQHYREEAEHREHKHDLNLFENVHGAAYGYSTLGSPLFAPLPNLKSFTRPEVLKNFWLPNITADRINFVAVGVPHEVALELAEQEFSDLEAGTYKRAPAQYVGGDVRMHASPIVHSAFDKKNTHVAFAWKAEAAGSADALAVGLLSAVLGADKPLFGTSAPLAVRALNTRLNARILARGLASRATSFTNTYSDSGLFGVYAVCKPSESAALSSALLAEVQALASSPVSDEELSRAKLALTHSLLYPLDSRVALLNSIGTQLSTTGSVVDPAAAAAAVAKLTAADLQRVAAKIVKTPLTVAASGDLTKLPRYDQLVAQFK